MGISVSAMYVYGFDLGEHLSQDYETFLEDIGANMSEDERDEQDMCEFEEADRINKILEPIGLELEQHGHYELAHWVLVLKEVGDSASLGEAETIQPFSAEALRKRWLKACTGRFKKLKSYSTNMLLCCYSG